ncbi:uncharacterized protein Z519_08359 [Cladophialophora bantiana CBS 173.52]|uniref:Uncharacterized protein n=1 Tax=Cladophialophora bantiana (strain ATCC 10958 / CBS 173.52 / CDC B-1940 / NIH 8579) TaxID=1442370 RepID=A0A0D2HDU8_CLAB1|nr:uncharacterized protein Z519_08359 [Cladophialophora bantiana CBS 173.52]KIW91463.1 hypothetical protein Z519_08359 [Cladophialophora bantiana CBS 173.52]
MQILVSNTSPAARRGDTGVHLAIRQDYPFDGAPPGDPIVRIQIAFYGFAEKLDNEIEYLAKAAMGDLQTRVPHSVNWPPGMMALALEHELGPVVEQRARTVFPSFAMPEISLEREIALESMTCYYEEHYPSSAKPRSGPERQREEDNTWSSHSIRLSTPRP